eukprot:g4755.t1
MSFLTNLIEGIMYAPDVWERTHNTHVEDTVKQSKIRKDAFDTPLRPDGYWRGRKMTIQNRVDQLPSKRHDGHVVVGIDKNANPLSANSLNTALAVLDAMYAREANVEKFLSEQRKKEGGS